jgi:probable HAF family extracellular repeat protein
MMRSIVLSLLATCATLACATAAAADAAPVPGTSPQVIPRFTAVDIGNLGGLGGTLPYGMDDLGRIVGNSVTADGGQHGFVTGPEGVGMIDICPTKNYCGARGINDHGEVVGFQAPRTPGYWAEGIVVRADGTHYLHLSTLYKGGTISPAAVNRTGQIAGYVGHADPKSVHAIVTTPNGIAHDFTDLGSLGTGAGDISWATAINTAGMVVGATGVGKSRNPTHAFVVEGVEGGMVDLGTLGGDNSIAYGVSNDGWIVGTSETPGNAANHAFIDRFGAHGFVDIGTLGGGDYSAAISVNSRGHAVGFSSLAGWECDHAFIYDATTARLVDLNALVDLPKGVVLWGAIAINEKDQIAAYDGTEHAYLLTPIRP